MLLINKGKEFELSHDGKTHIIPEGKFHCSSTLGRFLKEKNSQWEKIDVEVLDNSQELKDFTKIIPVKEEKIEDEIKEEVKVDEKIEEIAKEVKETVSTLEEKILS